MSRFDFRPVTPDDHPALARLWRESASVMGLDNTTLPPLTELERRLGADFGAAWELTLAFDGPEMAGFLAIRPDKRELGQIFLSPAFIGQGLGRMLFQMACDRMPGGFWLYTPAVNARARRFYERQGMRQTRTGLHPEAGHEIVFYDWPGA